MCDGWTDGRMDGCFRWEQMDMIQRVQMMFIHGDTNDRNWKEIKYKILVARLPTRQRFWWKWTKKLLAYQESDIGWEWMHDSEDQV